MPKELNSDQLVLEWLALLSVLEQKMKNKKLVIVCVGLSVLVGVLFVWFNNAKPERKPAAAAILPGFSTPFFTPTRDLASLPTSFYTVDEVWTQADTLNHQRIAIRGLAGYYLTTEDLTQYCIHDCGCMRSAGLDFLLRGSEHVVVISSPQCRYDQRNCNEEWVIECRPFDPHIGEAYEMVGKLAVFYEGETIVRLVLQLEYEDVKNSSQLIGEGSLAEQSRVPLILRTATFSFPIDEIPGSQIVPTPTPVPGLPTYYGFMTTDGDTLDPQQAEDEISLNFVENLFVQLTNVDVATGEIVPDAAANWTINSNATVYTFTLRTDIPWVNHDPSIPGTQRVFDEAGQPRFVTAQDFVNGIKRLCDPANQTYHGVEVVAPLLKGCAAARVYPALTAIPLEVWQAIGVRALDQRTLVIELTEPASQFLAITTLGVMSAVPQWLLEDKEWGEYWTEAGTIVTNGRFVLGAKVNQIHIKLERNSLFPLDLAGSGNIEHVLMIALPDVGTGYSLWLNRQIDLTTIPPNELALHLSNFPHETETVGDDTFFYFAVDLTRPPFNDVRVRQAFSAALDQNAFAQLPFSEQTSLIVPNYTGTVALGAQPMQSSGVGFNPDYARAQLAAAGYPNCTDFPTIDVSSWSSQLNTTLVPLILTQWSAVLGCSVETWQIHACGSATAPCHTIPGGDAHLRLRNWTFTYPDRQNGMSEIFSCVRGQESPYYRQTCQLVDAWIAAAAATPDPSQRQALYQQIETAFFGPDGEFPIVPLFARTIYLARQDWLTYTYNPYGAQQWYNWSVDAANQSRARNE